MRALQRENIQAVVAERQEDKDRLLQEHEMEIMDAINYSPLEQHVLNAIEREPMLRRVRTGKGERKRNRKDRW